MAIFTVIQFSQVRSFIDHELQLNENSVISHPHTTPNPYDCLFSVEHKRKYLTECSCCSFQYNGSEWGQRQLSSQIFLELLHM